MGDFKRSPSKVWWASESLERRELSQSPGSQDSGFSDSETSPPLQLKENKETADQRIPREIFKDSSPTEKPQNLSINYKEKLTPEKSIKSQLNAGSSRVSRYSKNSPKISRNLFNSKRKEIVKDADNNQYSEDVSQDTTHSSISSEITCSDSYSCVTDDIFENPKSSKSLPLQTDPKHSECLNKSAPAILTDKEDEENKSFNGNHSLSSDCESELECLFNEILDSPQHTSTPKAGSLNTMRHRRNKVALNLYLKYQQERVSPPKNEALNNPAVKKWLEEIMHTYEKECMTTLQSKSIAGELNQRVSKMAIYTTTKIRNIMSHSDCIQMEYKNLNGEKKHIAPLAQSLAGNIIDFINTYVVNVDDKISKQYDEIRKAKAENALQLVLQLFDLWQSISFNILTNEAQKLLERLENPCSELDLRATVTGITSIALRNEALIDIFTKNDIVTFLLTLCERCEGSSLRSLLLRALSTMCCSTYAVRQFEKFSGIQVVTETLEEESRPEPERSEAVALLAQVTAPWIEDNHCIKGLPEYSKRLVKSLTKFAGNTKCCQNLLLCAAALANLSTMDSRCIKYMTDNNTIRILLESVNRRGTCASVYLLEQVATLIANMSVADVARKQLTNVKAAAALLCFLKMNGTGEDVEKRLQQKSVIALSRLCSDVEAASQVVELGGVEKLVKMCREKEERYDSDAVLVATLATLRKISDACGRNVINAEDAQELVEPKLLDSFLAYSTQSESYV